MHLRLGERRGDGNVARAIAVQRFARPLSCIIAPACGLTGVLNEALAAFLAVLDGYTLADVVVKRRRLASLLGLDTPPPS